MCEIHRSINWGNPNGLVHATKSELSVLHSKRFTSAFPVSFPENVKVIEFDLVLLLLERLFLLLSTTESIEVVGGEVSISPVERGWETGLRFTTLSSDLTAKI